MKTDTGNGKSAGVVKIGVISDTHGRTFHDIPDAVLLALSEVDLIVHAGDFTQRAVLAGLLTLGPVKAVAGNMDSPELKRLLPATELFEVNGKKVGLTHGSGGPGDLAYRVRHMFPDADIIIYGHSHAAAREFVEGSMLFNPGPARASFGILTVGYDIRADIVRV